jgi:pseudaminic acid biosynthesis-associated methylase
LFLLAEGKTDLSSNEENLQYIFQERKKMNTIFNTEQENFWAGEFGNEYITRNNSNEILTAKINFFNHVFKKTNSIKTILEYGANIGLNLISIKKIIPNVELSCIEINQKAVNELKKIEDLKIYHDSILNYSVDYKRNLVFTCGVLIHIDPVFLPKVYELMYNSSNRYILLSEYYNPTPVEVSYRGHKNKLFKRDFAGEMLDKFQDLTLIDYGFKYHRDNNNPMDDVNWFLLEKNKI